MDDKEYYEKIKKVNKDNLYKKINKNKSDKWENFEVTGKMNKKLLFMIQLLHLLNQKQQVKQQKFSMIFVLLCKYLC